MGETDRERLMDFSHQHTNREPVKTLHFERCEKHSISCFWILADRSHRCRTHRSWFAGGPRIVYRTGFQTLQLVVSFASTSITCAERFMVPISSYQRARFNSRPLGVISDCLLTAVLFVGWQCLFTQVNKVEMASLALLASKSRSTADDDSP